MCVVFSSGQREMKEKHVVKLKEKIVEAYGKNWKAEEIDKKTDDLTSSVKFCCQNTQLVSKQLTLLLI